MAEQVELGVLLTTKADLTGVNALSQAAQSTISWQERVARALELVRQRQADADASLKAMAGTMAQAGGTLSTTTSSLNAQAQAASNLQGKINSLSTSFQNLNNSQKASAGFGGAFSAGGSGGGNNPTSFGAAFSAAGSSGSSPAAATPEKWNGLFNTGINTFQAFAAIRIFEQMTGAINDAVKSVVDLNQASQNLSQILGITNTESMGWVLSAQAMGVSTDTVTEAFRTFGDRLGRATGLFGEPTKGSRDMANAMKALGIETLNADGSVRGMNDILPEIFDKISQLGPGIETTAIATALFGQRADEMIPILLKGKEGYDSFVQFAQNSSLALSKVDIEKLRAFTVESEKLGLATKGLLTQIGLGLADSLIPVFEYIIKVIQATTDRFILMQAVILGSTTAFEVYVKSVISIWQNLWQFITTGNVEALSAVSQAITNTFGAALSEMGKTIDTFLASKGKKLNMGLSGGDFTDWATSPLTNIDNGDKGINPSGMPDTGTDSAAKKAAAKYDEIKKLSADFYNWMSEHLRDFNLKQARENEDFMNDRAKKTIDFNLKIGEEFQKFYSEQQQRQEDHDTKMSRQADDFNQKQANDELDFNTKISREQSKFLQDQNDNQADYAIKRQRAIEDYERKISDTKKTSAEQRVKLVDEENKAIEKLQEKWDEILLRLRIGGDQDSIAQAQIAAAAALDDQKKKNADELALFDEKKAAQEKNDKEDLELKLKRMEEDFNTTQERAKRDFEAKQSQQIDDFKRDQALAKANFAEKQKREEEDFAIAQNRREEQYNLKLSQEIEHFQLDLQRANDAHNLKAKREAEDFANDIADEIKRYQARLLNLTQEYADLLTATAAGQSALVAAQQAGQDAQTAVAASGSANRIAIAKAEAIAIGEALANTPRDNWYSDTGRHALGGIVPGPLGAPSLAVVHGGERFSAPASASYYQNVRHGDQFSANTTLNFNNTVTGANSQSIINQASKELGKAALLKSAMRGK